MKFSLLPLSIITHGDIYNHGPSRTSPITLSVTTEDPGPSGVEGTHAFCLDSSSFLNGAVDPMTHLQITLWLDILTRLEYTWIQVDR